jgi:hypothetical protein
MRNLLRAFFSCTLFTLLFSVALAVNVSAQTAAESERARIMAERDQAAREWQLRNIGKVKRVDVDVAPIEVSLLKVKEDYEGIQQANNDVLKMLSANKGLDYKLIADSASEIKKRASRLKSYLIALEIVKDDKERKRNLDEIEGLEMRASLLSLDASIVSLIGSPVFKEFGKVVDVDSSEKARSDLDNIIELSERIKKSAERTIKGARASR